MTLAQVYKRQEAAAQARDTERQTYDDIYFETPPEQHYLLEENPDIVAAKQRTAALEAEVAGLQQEAGGKVYRVADEKLEALQARIDKLNLKAEKLGVERVELRVTEEKDQTTSKRELTAAEGRLGPGEITGEWKTVVHDWTFVIVNGEAPAVPGFTFLAVLDHTVQDDENDPVTINRIPAAAFRLATDAADEDEAQRQLDAIDLTGYRRAPNRCDHCGFIRNRHRTYVVFEQETGKTLQVGSTCLKDYTGHADPHRIARWAEYLAALDRDLGIGGEPGNGSGRLAEHILDYLAHTAAVIRENGWTPRWLKNDYGNERQHGTADQAHDNIFDTRRGKRPPKVVEVTRADAKQAEEALEWARETYGDRDDLDDFEHNLAAVTRGDYLPEKGDGLVAYVIQGFIKTQEQQVAEEAGEKIEPAPVPVIDKRLTIEGAVLSGPTWKDSDYGGAFKMTVLDDRGFRVWGTCPEDLVEWEAQTAKADNRIDRQLQGQRVRFDARVKPSNDDETFGWFSRPTKAEVLDA